MGIRDFATYKHKSKRDQDITRATAEFIVKDVKPLHHSEKTRFKTSVKILKEHAHALSRLQHQGCIKLQRTVNNTEKQ